ncbi:MAG: DNA helicase II [Verrucomicrobia bacterium]|nr:DNA helicase II [Verrucomicrobiota bacterium]
MDVSKIFDALNDAQREAVGATPGPMLVLAGAGSGKTRVLTYRIAYLVQALQASPYSILAVTFTNKAASEMRRRIEDFLGFSVRGMWIGTFHGLSHRLLRDHHELAGLPSGFEILDSDDQYRVIRRALREMNLDEEHWPPRQVQWFINSQKEEGRRSAALHGTGDAHQQTLIRVYTHYEETCKRLGLVDFAELLLSALELLEQNQSLRENYQQRFQHVLVDEFQDSNTIQYRWLKCLALAHGQIMAVGDDDQSIYGWRGARIENMAQLQKDFTGTEVVRLEQNYRSTGNILKAANAVIDLNPDRMGKNLWTEGDDGEPIRVYGALDELDEGRFVIDRIEAWQHLGRRRDSIGILYRSNAQSRVFEELLLARGIPYRVYGGLRFFERAEIKDALAYLRLVTNRDSDPAFERVVNVPPRGIGARTVEIVRQQARTDNTSLWTAAKALTASEGLPARARGALAVFVDLIDQLALDSADHDLPEKIDLAISRSGLIDHYRKERGEKAITRVENLEELVSAGRNFESEADDDSAVDELADFLAHAALEAGEGQAAEWEDCVQLMSLHSAKGLEFPLVFLCGMEEGLFPHQRSIDEPGGLEEERRLCYVGMTRAMEQLYLTCAEVRRLYGRENTTSPSRFLSEVPESLVEDVRAGAGLRTRAVKKINPNIAHINASSGTEASSLRLGAAVNHKKFGPGTVVMIEGQGEHARVQVRFEKSGSKWLVLAYANLEPA